MPSKNPESSAVIVQSQRLPFSIFLQSESHLLYFTLIILIICDFVISVGSLLLAFYLRHSESVFYFPTENWFPYEISWRFRPYWSLLFFIPMVRLITLYYYDLYRLRGEYSYFQDIASLFKAVTMGSLIIIVIVFLFRGGYTYRTFSYSRLVFVYDWGVSFGFYWMLRLFLRTIQSVARHYSLNLIPTLVVGTGQEACTCISEIVEDFRLGYKVVGVLKVKKEISQKLDPVEVEGIPVLGEFTDLTALAKQHGVTEILITDSTLPPSDIFKAMMRSGRKHKLSFHVVPNLFNCMPRKTEIDEIGSLPMIRLFEDPLAGPNRILKRAIDVLGASFSLLILFPFWIFVSLLIKKESKGPILYKQERVGMDGRIFQMYKFRSMYTDTDDEIHRDLMKETIANPEGANQGTSDQPIFGKIQNDPRLTKVGEWIRRFSIDEWPNLINVLVGNMSLVGPRPPIPYEVEIYQEWHRARFNIKPGITGLWQVSGRNRLNFEQMVQLDLYYIENWSIWLELKILFKTIPVVLKGDNAY